MMACVCCGLEGVDGVCSMCYGDPNHNTDGEYERWLEQQAQNEQVEDDPALYDLDTTPEPGYQDTPPVDKLRACLAVGIGVRELWNMQRYLVCFDVDSPDMSDIPF